MYNIIKNIFIYYFYIKIFRKINKSYCIHHFPSEKRGGSGVTIKEETFLKFREEIDFSLTSPDL